jgi:dihydropteroate synthase
MTPFSLNINQRIVEFTRPAVMGILNVTPDSFYEASHAFNREQIAQRVNEMLAQGADIIDLGGYSSRPGADEVTVDEEMRRVALGLEIIRSINTDIPVSIDTFRASVAKRAITEWGGNIINDISAGGIDDAMFDTVAELNVPYILMHMRGTPKTMQQLTNYDNVTADVIAELSRPLHQLTLSGVSDIIIDPGFGFAKTLEQNYELFNHLPEIIDMLQRPVMVGISRKSMITRLCNTTADKALAGTTALNTVAVMHGASILRVHDVAEARQAVDVALQLC